MKETPNVITIPREDAVFWLDARGRWNNEHGPFQHPKVSAYFHACIKRDANGYYVGQQRDEVYEKVYFRYEDTALFVFGVEFKGEEVTFRLNTGRLIKLKPADLFIKNDDLYTQTAEGPAKFNQQSLMRVSKLVEEENGELFIRVGGETFKIPELV